MDMLGCEGNDSAGIILSNIWVYRRFGVERKSFLIKMKMKYQVFLTITYNFEKTKTFQNFIIMFSTFNLVL
jgi:predicted transcriptional regulator